MNQILQNQLAIDFCTDEKSVASNNNIFTIYQKLDGRRIFKETECYLKVACVNGKLLATGKKEIMDWFKEQYQDTDGAWFMDMENLHQLEKGLKTFGCQIGNAHPFYIATSKSDVDTKNYEIQIYTGNQLEQFRHDSRFSEAFLFEDLPKDEIGIAAYKDGKLLGMAGASSDSFQMWQIGINVLEEYQGLGIGTMLVKLLKNEILDRHKLPFYGTSMSHIASLNVAIKSGFYPAWAELYCTKIEEENKE